MYKWVAVTAVVASLGSTPASADPAIASLGLAAEVDSFCKIDSGQRAVAADGSIGLVREVCNMPGGYRVSARFSNLQRASILAGDVPVSLDSTGTAVVTTDGPRAHGRIWSLSDARPADAARPVTVRFSISPL